ncbi:MAG: hypothetical protein ACODAC_00795 [Pseudomonadota bacterium]
MRDAARRQILSDMGIDIWWARGARSLPPDPDAAGPVADSAEPPPAEDSARGAQALEALKAATAPEPAAVPDTPPRPPAAVDPGPEPGPAPEPVSAISMAVPGAVMLIEDQPSKLETRLARDVLAAASGNWRARPAHRRFAWPPEVGDARLHGGPEAGRRALAAFVGKDVSDHAAGLVLCSEALAELLPEQGPGWVRVVVPALGDLGADADAKRALWRDIRRAVGGAGAE